MSGYKERQIIHIKEVFRESSDGSHAWAVDDNRQPQAEFVSPNTTRSYTSDPLAGVQLQADDELSRVNGTMTNGEQAQAESSAKRSSKKKRPALRPPESSDPRSASHIEQADTEARTVLPGSQHPENITSANPSSAATSNHLPPPHTVGNSPDQSVASGQNNAVTPPSTSGIKQSTTGRKYRAPDPPSSHPPMSWPSGKENLRNPPEEPIYLPGSVCQSDTGTIASSGYHSDIMKETVAAELANGDNSSDFEEEEFCVDFDEEEEDEVPTQAKHTQVYREFEGEDYSKYLEDDIPDEAVLPPAPSREGKKRKGRAQPPLSPASSLSVSSDERTLSKKSGLRQKISKVFTMSRSENKNKSREWEAQNNSIHNFTFSDSKLGNLKNDSEITDPGYRQSHALGDGESKSDLGTSEAHWWNTGTLSARGKKNVMGSRSTSVPNIADDNSTDHRIQTSKGVSPPTQSSNNSNNGTASSRKSGMYETKGQSTQAKKSNIWKKFTKSLRKEQKADYYGEDDLNTTPGSLNEQQHLDIRL